MRYRIVIRTTRPYEAGFSKFRQIGHGARIDAPSIYIMSATERAECADDLHQRYDHLRGVERVTVEPV